MESSIEAVFSRSLLFLGCRVADSLASRTRGGVFVLDSAAATHSLAEASTIVYSAAGMCSTRAPQGELERTDVQVYHSAIIQQMPAPKAHHTIKMAHVSAAPKPGAQRREDSTWNRPRGPHR